MTLTLTHVLSISYPISYPHTLILTLLSYHSYPNSDPNSHPTSYPNSRPIRQAYLVMVGRDVAPSAITHVMASAKDTIYGFTMLREPFHAEELVRTKVSSYLCHHISAVLSISLYLCVVLLCYNVLMNSSLTYLSLNFSHLIPSNFTLELTPIFSGFLTRPSSSSLSIN